MSQEGEAYAKLNRQLDHWEDILCILLVSPRALFYKSLSSSSFSSSSSYYYYYYYSISGPYEWKSWMDPWYWVYKEPTASQLKEETEQFKELTEHLLTTYKNKRFILQIWEGDWELRQGLPVEDR